MAITLDGLSIDGQDVNFPSRSILSDYSSASLSLPYAQKIVAASNSSQNDKAIADYICDGVNDEVEINSAIDAVKSRIGTVILCDGDYYIDAFSNYTFGGRTEKAAIRVVKSGMSDGVTITGCASTRQPKAIIHVNERAFSGLSSSDQPSVITGGASATGYIGRIGFNLRCIQIFVPNTHKVIVVNYQHCYWGMVDSCLLMTTNYGQDIVPVEGCIGLRGWAGWSDGMVIGAKDTYCAGFYVGFQLGGEHVICERLGGRFNYYSYTFGEYEFDSDSGAQVHPITLINCCDEHQAALPKFCTSGPADNRGAGRCAVDMISFNIEYYPLITGTPIIGATEDTDGGWVGRIDYTIENNESNSSVSLPFWANGHGKNFRTTNSAQKEMGSTTLRRSYAANYMQQFYDETLNKVVFCKEPATNTWIDALGTTV